MCLWSALPGEALSPPDAPRVYPLGDRALVVPIGNDINRETHERVRETVAKLEAKRPTAMVEVVPAFTTVTITYDPLEQNYASFRADVERLLQESFPSDDLSSRAVDVPVCYGGDLGPDLQFVASYHGLEPDEVVRIHSEEDYLVYMIGFAPGFPYLGGLSNHIATPRRDSPREKVPARSVAIGGSQTGIYSIESPGGWHIIGRTPIDLFVPSRDPPTLLQIGDSVCFQPISRREYHEMVDEES